MTIQQCKYIIKIAETGSFNEASKQLFLAPSSLSVSVKVLEDELGIKIFSRSGNGVYLTNDGAEFVSYARQIVEQSAFVLNRYQKSEIASRLFVSTQHYDFVADTFTKLLNEIEDKSYKMTLREMKTYDVIRDTETAYCDIGIIAIKDSDYGLMERYINQRGLIFTPIRKALPHVYLRRGHPLASKTIITSDDIKIYPYLFYEQGDYGNSFFAEEIVNCFNDKQIAISDRASLMNILLATDSLTIGTGIMPSSLNTDRIVGIPFENNDCYIIGYILRSDCKTSKIVQKFIELLDEI